MEEIVYKSVGDFGVTATLFVIFMLGLFYAIMRYVPKLFNAHFQAVREMQDQFSEDLRRITDKNAQASDKFLEEMRKLSHDHELQNKILEKLDKTQDEIFEHVRK